MYRKEVMLKNNAELVFLVADLLMQGKSHMSIKKEVHSYDKSVTLKAAEELILYVKEEFNKTFADNVNYVRSLYAEMYLDLYHKTYELGQYKDSKVILDSLVKLNGLLTDKVEISAKEVYDIKFD